ncbi:WxL domain-containing protein [Enterococcus thailandicus]|uniref:WxL domain-containing protein n=1 Tax=Enterococcus thailandicus TaxID=417368 RepID=UPI0022EBF9A8|nr:WxL domain-containing protein [Enterococcus thailandicus]MDA3972743.1 WxL domain-containing protein [Enterococcus thailandicus]MDA3975239.1 WxL domain-containing protein [Enterococcus thailandicus]MDA3980203.1 WxL domain-containing protein [Enterococcus thailandicus]
MNHSKILKVAALTALGLSATLSASVQAAEVLEVPYKTTGIIEFVPNTDPTKPVDPENPDPNEPVEPTDPTSPDEKPSPGTEGPLSIDFASSLDFGSQKISNKNETYFARSQKFTNGTPARGNYVQVSDNRGTNAGWSLFVKQNGQFISYINSLNGTLTGAEITLSNSAINGLSHTKKPEGPTEIKLKPTAEDTLVMASTQTAGAGTWVNVWGTAEDVVEKDETGKDATVSVNKAVNLFIPGDTPKDAVKYMTTLTWTLKDVPAPLDIPEDPAQTDDNA